MDKCYCPKCGNEVKNNDIRCSHCGMRLKTICPACETLNDFGCEKCSNCGKLLLKYCENCGSANFPDASLCRKCNKIFEKSVITPEKNKSVLTSLKKMPTIKKEHAKIDINKITENKIITPVSLNNTPDIYSAVKKDELISETVSDDFEHGYDEEQIAETQTLASDGAEIQQTDFEQDNFVQDEFSEDIIDEEPKVSDDIEEDAGEVFTEESADEPAEDEFLEEEFLGDDSSENTSEDNYADDAEVSKEEPEAEDEIIVQEPDFIGDNEMQNHLLLPKEDDKITDFSEAQDLLNSAISLTEQSDKKVIAICGEEGMGKTTIINALISSLSQKQIMTMYSECSELTKIAPFGAIRDSLLRLLTLPDFHPDMPSYFSEQSKKLFASNFPGLNAQEIVDFMNFLYPSMAANYRDLYKNKSKTYQLLENILKSISSNNNIILVIDNFNLIDSSSYEFINHLILRNIINEKLKLIVTYEEHKSAKYYFDEKFINSDIFETLSINNMDEVRVSKMVQNFVNTDNVPADVLMVINNNGSGNIFFAEQYLALLFDAGYIVLNQNMMYFNTSVQLPYAPNDIEEIIKLRLNIIQVQELKESLYAASVLGYKFDRNVFAEVMDYSLEQADEVLLKLAELMYIQKSTNYEYSFKNMTLWNTVFNEVQTVPNFKPLCKKIYYIMGKYGLSNVTVKAAIAKHRDVTESEFQSWKVAADTAAYLGDEYIYTVCYDQWLIASGYSETSEQITDAQIEVLENLGRIYSFDKPDTAVKYLVKPILYAQKQQNIPKMIELSAYMIKACDKINNYNGILETIDMVLAADTGMKPFEKAIILSKKMPALFVLGNCDEAINLANNDLLPVLEEELSKSIDSEQMTELFNIWFDVSVSLANIYSLQGNSQSLPYISNIEETVKMNNLLNDKYLICLTLAKAFAHVVFGNLNDCFIALNSLSDMDFSNNKIYQSHYNIILSLAKICSGQSESLKKKLLEYAMYSDDNFDVFGKHVFKMLFAKLLFMSGDYLKSIEIFNEELNFFAKEKIVTGALISWLFISEINLRTGSADSAENMALKALEVAQNPKFSQYHISIYLQKLIAEINIEKGDFDAAKMYIEKAMLIAKQFDLELAKFELYKLYIRLLRQLLMNASVDVVETANKINLYYKLSIASLKKIHLAAVLNDIQEEYESFINYCNKNSIALS